jgi:protoporphyrinogen/coproporphyrinogen III oxidase
MSQPVQKTHPKRIAIVGAGFAGLTAANRLRELSEHSAVPCEVVLFESSTRTGGLVGTRHINGYTVELGADSFITNKPWCVDLCRRLGLEDRLIPTDARFRRSFVLRNGKPVPVPEGFQLLAPIGIGAVLKSPIFSWHGKLRLACELFVPRAKGNHEESLAAFVRRRLGQEALERLIQPLVGGIYTSDPEKLSLRATMPRFIEMEQRYGSLIRALRAQQKSGRAEDPTASGARYGLFATPQTGISEIVDALTNKVSQFAKIRFQTEVRGLVPNGPQGGYTLRLADQQQESFDAVILAIPAYQIATLTASYAPALAGHLNQIEYASTAIVVSGHKLSDIKHPLDAFGLVVPAIEKRRILAVSFTSRKFPNRAPDGCVELRTFVGGAMQPEYLKLSDDEIIQLVREELQDILGVSWKPDFTVVARWMRSMPQYHVGHEALIEQIDRELQAFPGLAVAGHAYHGVGLPDTVRSGERAAEQVFG